MHRNTWKAAELWWARVLGGERIPVSGRAFGTEPDVRHTRYAIEVKCGRVLPTRLSHGMDQAVATARLEQVPIVCLTHKQGRGYPGQHYVLIRLVDWLRVTGGEPGGQLPLEAFEAAAAADWPEPNSPAAHPAPGSLVAVPAELLPALWYTLHDVRALLNHEGPMRQTRDRRVDPMLAEVERLLGGAPKRERERKGQAKRPRARAGSGRAADVV